MIGSALMIVFALTCMAVMGLAFVPEAPDPKSVGAVSPSFWYGVLAGLRIWLLVLAALAPYRAP